MNGPMANAMASDAGEETGTVTSADGTVIAFQRTGSGPPLVLVHGNGDVHEFWDLAGVRTAFAQHCTVYAIDRRGRGESDDVQRASSAEPTRTGGSGGVTRRSSVGQPEAHASGDVPGYELEREAEDVAAVVDSIDEPVTLLGHSGGAIYSLEAALRTDNVRELVLNEPPIAVGDHDLDVEEVVAAMKWLLDDGENEQTLVLFLQEVAHLTPAELDAARSAPIWQKMVDAAHTLPRELQAIAEYEFDPARFADVTTPTLLLFGGESPPFYRDATEAVNDVLPNGRIVTFDGHAHEPMNTAPDRFVNEVLTFMRESN